MSRPGDRERSGSPDDQGTSGPDGARDGPRGENSSREQARSADQGEQGSRGETDPQEEQESSERQGEKSQGGMSSRSGGNQDKGQQGQQKKGVAEEGESTGPTPTQWAVGIGSSLLVLALLGFVIYEAFSGTGTPPLVTVRVERVLEAPNGYVVEVGVYNEGGTTASGLVIEGTLKRDTTTVETSSTTLKYVPAETEREAGLFFSHDPRRYRLEVRPKGYDHP